MRVAAVRSLARRAAATVAALVCLLIAARALPAAEPLGCYLVGVVVDELGRPVAGASVSLVMTDGAPFKKHVETDAEGRFVIDQVPEGIATLVIIARDAVRVTRDLRSTSGTVVRVAARIGGDRRTLEIETSEEVCVSDFGGRVLRRADRGPAVGVVVIASADGFAELRARTDERGEYRLTGAPCGAYEVWLDREPAQRGHVWVSPVGHPKVSDELLFGPGPPDRRTSPLPSDGRRTRWLGALDTSFTFVSSDTGIAGKPFDMPEVVLWQLGASAHLGCRFDLSSTVTLLPKEPSLVDAPLFQAADLRLRTRFGRRSSVTAIGALGTTIGAPGSWRGGELSVETIAPMGRHLSAGGALGGRADAFSLDGVDDAPWLAEVVARGELVSGFEDPDGDEGLHLWLGVELGVPVAAGGELPGDVAFEDSSRASVGLGFDLQLGPWTVLLSYRVLDRGDAEAPGTLLPVVQGGFSQSQFMFGVRRSLAGKR